MNRSRLYALLAMALLLLPMLACGGSGDSEPTRAPVPTWTPTPAATVEPTPTPSRWQQISAAYRGPDGSPTDAELRQSFLDIMSIANEIVMDSASTPEEQQQAQVIFDAAADAHDAMIANDDATLAERWKSLDTFVALLR